jgi:hypothetical protein
MLSSIQAYLLGPICSVSGQLHGFGSDFGVITFWTSASKRGSPRSGSSIGSTLIQLRFAPSRSA